MRVLLCHNFYRSSAPSGEDAVFRNERALLESNGVEVIPFERFNDDIDDSTLLNRLDVAASTIWSRKTYKAIEATIRKTRPDIAHFHNTFPQISPSAYAACSRSRVPVIQTLHNYRLICPGALLLREGKPCEDCLGHSLLPALRHRCYRNSLTATGALVGMLSLNRARGTYLSSVSRYIALTQFSATRYELGGLPANRIVVKPNFLPSPPPFGRGQGGYVVYVGRLSEEKGLKTLLKAWHHVNNLPLKILGDGPLKSELIENATQNNLNIEFMGSLPRNEVLDIISHADLQVIPSEWYEGFPMVALEGYACGTPILASRIGSLTEIIIDGETGTTFEPGNDLDLAQNVIALLKDRDTLATMRNTTRKHFDSNFTAKQNFEMLMNIYDTNINGLKNNTTIE
ncbi:glycosyltransferase family 4 protein [Pseudomonadota bacterium]